MSTSCYSKAVLEIYVHQNEVSRAYLGSASNSSQFCWI